MTAGVYSLQPPIDPPPRRAIERHRGVTGQNAFKTSVGGVQENAKARPLRRHVGPGTRFEHFEIEGNRADVDCPVCGRAAGYGRNPEGVAADGLGSQRHEDRGVGRRKAAPAASVQVEDEFRGRKIRSELQHHFFAGRPARAIEVAMDDGVEAERFDPRPK